MSYEKCKTISLKPKTNQIFVTIASNNSRPLIMKDASMHQKKIVALMIN